MNKRNLAVIMFAALLGALGVGPAALAQEQDDSVFDTVIVTAQKREQSIYDVPVSISAFSPEAMEKQGITDLTDIGKFVPNLNITGFSGGHTSSQNPFIRGIGLQDHLITTEPGVGVYIDGVYLGRQVGQNWSFANIERVEVLRGPQGTLYGRNSIGGAINIITRKPGDEPGGKVSLMAGSRGRLNGDVYADMPISDEFAMSFSLAYQRRDGLGDFLLIEDPNKQVGEMQDISGRIAMQWKPTDKLSFLLTGDGNDGENGLRPYYTLIDELGAACRANPPAPPANCTAANGAVYNAGYRNSDRASDHYDNNTGQADQIEVTNRAYGVSLTADLEVSDALSFKLLASDRHSEYKSGLDDDSFHDDFLSFPEIGSADQQSLELQATGTAGALDYVLGLFYYEEEGQNFQNDTSFNCGTAAAPCPAPNSGDFFLHQKYNSQAIYANVGYHVTDALRIAAGLRYTQDDKDADTMPVVGVIGASNSNDGSQTTWDVSASYKFRDRLTFYGAVQSGYQAGQYPARPFCLFGNPNCFVATENVTAINYEVGMKGELFDNLQLSIALFNTKYTDLPYQVSTTTGAGFSTQSIVVDQTSRGAELETTWAATDNFRLHVTVGYIDVDVDDPNPAAVAPLTPKMTASLSPELTIPTGSGEITLRADWSYRDDMFGEPSNDPARFTFIESRDLVNADISYRPADGDWTVGIYGRNITDERYDNARLNTGDYVLVMLSNDASEFGVRFSKEF
ncbi:MAG TPA: TonB-dependent receptor [Steroidobacteraceae bacterium]|nr:TonB-dependent receptor [Steroidobacteraceae bacterium]